MVRVTVNVGVRVRFSVRFRITVVKRGYST